MATEEEILTRFVNNFAEDNNLPPRFLLRDEQSISDGVRESAAFQKYLLAYRWEEFKMEFKEGFSKIFN